MTCLMAAGRPGHCHLLVLVPADGGQSPQAGFCRPWRDLTGFWTANPPLKRWAIIGRPAGTGEEGRRQGREAQSRNVMNSDGVGVGLDDLSSSPKAVTCPRTPKSPIANRRCLGRNVAPLQGAGRLGTGSPGVSLTQPPATVWQRSGLGCVTGAEAERIAYFRFEISKGRVAGIVGRRPGAGVREGWGGGCEGGRDIRDARDRKD